MATSQGFWSYVHVDDKAEGGRITRLAADLRDQYELLTGESLELFLDRDAIAWGDSWREKIDASLASIAFFIPVLTPRYFMSPECRRELQFFARGATKLGVKELVLPLLYVDIADLHDRSPEDDLLGMVQSYQWVDWRDLRFADPTSGDYRKSVVRLAVRIVEANRRAERTIVAVLPAGVEAGDADGGDEELGFIDRVAAAEEALPRLGAATEAIGEALQVVGRTMAEAADDIQRGDKQGKGFAARVVVTKRAARELGDPVERIRSLSNEFVSMLHDVDLGFRAIIEHAPKEVERDPDSIGAVCGFFASVRSLSEATHSSLGSMQKLVDAIIPNEGLSRYLRPSLRSLRQGLTVMVEASGVSDEWVQWIEATGIRCGVLETDGG